MQKKSSLAAKEHRISQGFMSGTTKQSPSERQRKESKLITLKTPRAIQIKEAVVGRVVGFKSPSEAFVDFPDNPAGEALAARSTLILGENEVGREVVLLFEQGDPERPIIMGLIQNSSKDQTVSSQGSGNHTPKLWYIERDSEKVALTAEREITLRCGEASITLTRAGKVLIRGTYVLSCSSGVNRVRGGSVQIN